MTKRHRSQRPQHVPRRPVVFAGALESIKWLKRSVYSIARGRIRDPANPVDQVWVTIGTGCVVAPNRMITACHVVNGPANNNPMTQHVAGDQYYLLRHDDEGNWHFRRFTPEMNRTLFLYPDVDLAVLYLEEEFYQHGAVKDDFIRVDQNFHQIGTEVAVLGYPLVGLTFENRNVDQPKVGDILLRADTGIVNCRYRTAPDVFRYEFTMGFNPGNSGGPIFSPRTGMLLSIVHGYKAIPINRREHILTDDEKRSIAAVHFSHDSIIEVVHGNYSVGYATPSFLEAFREHRII